jgi:amidase
VGHHVGCSLTTAGIIPVMRATLVRLVVAGAAVCVLQAQGRTPLAAAPFSVVEASLTDLRQALDTGRTTSRAITQQYLDRLARYNARLHAANTISPTALADADARDQEHRTKRARGPLHGIPVAVKDNVQVLGMPTTGGALAFKTLRAPYEATLVGQLRAAGAIIVAKTTLTELANWVSVRMPTGYNALLGQSINPYDDDRSRPGSFSGQLAPGGSSSGIGTAASLWAASVGSETSGSILNPSNQTLLVGIKPTVGRISRYGVIPISGDQDTPGPMARTVADAAIMLGAMESGAPDPHDPATRACPAPKARDYTPFLRADGLRGARIGIPRTNFYDATSFFGTRSGNGLPTAQRTSMDDAIVALRAAGAVVVDPANIPSVTATDPEHSILTWSICMGGDSVGTAPLNCSIVLRYGMKRDFNTWLASLGPAAPVKTLSDLRAWNTAHAAEGAIAFGQGQLDASDAIDLERDAERYRHDRAKDLRLSRTEGIDAALRAARLDALLFPAYLGAPIAARAGYPSIIVPFPEKNAARERPTPFGVTFTGAACSEPKLIALAYAFEQATRRRFPPLEEH